MAHLTAYFTIFCLQTTSQRSLPVRRLGFAQIRWGSLQRSPDHLAGFRGLTSKAERGRENREGVGWEGVKGKGIEGGVGGERGSKPTQT